MNHHFCSDIVLDRVKKTIQLMEVIHSLVDPQSELLLPRNCAGMSKLYFTMRTTAPRYLHEAQVIFDTHLFSYMRHLIVNDGPGYGV